MTVERQLKRLGLATLAVLLFIGFNYGGRFVGFKLAYRYEQSRPLANLGDAEAVTFRDNGRVMEAITFFRIGTKNSPDSLQHEIAYLTKVRAVAPQDIKPVIDLRVGTDHAVLSKLYAQSNSVSDANREINLAQSLFRDLGWKDTSPITIDEVAEQQLRSRSAQ